MVDKNILASSVLIGIFIVCSIATIVVDVRSRINVLNSEITKASENAKNEDSAIHNNVAKRDVVVEEIAKEIKSDVVDVDVARNSKLVEKLAKFETQHKEVRVKSVEQNEIVDADDDDDHDGIPIKNKKHPKMMNKKKKRSIDSSPTVTLSNSGKSKQKLIFQLNSKESIELDINTKSLKSASIKMKTSLGTIETKITGNEEIHKKKKK